MMRRIGTLGLAGLLLLPSSGCASRRGWGWEAGMMGAMVVGGLVFGRGLMHGGGSSRAAFDADRFDPARLLAQRETLQLTEGQVAALESLRGEVAAGRLPREQAARAAYELLR
ncbi:MAG: hypothetical protein Q8S13_01760, partial [Dehalococcoidia bacterium]|nr:hypothetical protein [Dehalococcoidia bacterium]